MNPEVDQPAGPRRDKSRRRRWLRRFIIALVVLLLAVVIVVQLILWSDYPRRLIVESLERQLGMSISTGKLSVGWSGESSLTNTSVTLPLASAPILTAPRMQVHHTSIAALLLGRRFRIQQVELDSPVVDFRQDPAGRWNARLAFDLIQRATQRQQASGTSAHQPVAGDWPVVLARNGDVRITDVAQQKSSISPLRVTARPDGQLVYRVEADTGGSFALSGTLVAGGDWLHEAKIHVSDSERWIRAFLRAWPQEAQLDALWTGQRRGAGVTGRLDIATLRAPQFSASGIVEITTTIGALTIRPITLMLRNTGPLGDEALVTAGVVEIDPRELRVRGVQLNTRDGDVAIDGSWNPLAQTADARAIWQNLRLPDGTLHSGKLDGTLQTAFPGRPIINATLTSVGGMNTARAWSASAQLSAEGESFQALNWRITAPDAIYNWPRLINLSGISITGRTDGYKVVLLDDVTLPNRGQLTGLGRADIATGDWWLWLSGADLPITRSRGAKLTFDFNGWGRAKHATIDKAYLAAGDLELWMTGSYLPDEDDAISLSAWLTHLPLLGEETAEYVRGKMRSELHLTGRTPLDLKITGKMHGRDLEILDRAIGDIDAKVDGEFTSKWFRLATRKLKVFGADWDLDARWPTLDTDRTFELTLNVAGLALSEMSGLLNEPSLRGVASAGIDLRLGSAQLDQILATGTIQLSNAARGMLSADKVTAHLDLNRGRLQVDKIEARHGDGTFMGSAQTDLQGSSVWTVTGDLQNWPAWSSERSGTLFLTANTKALQVDLSQRIASGRAKLSGQLTRAGTPADDFSVDLTADGKVIRLAALQGTLLGGTFEGRGELNMEDPLQSTGAIDMHAFNARRLQDWLPHLDAASGALDGTIRITKAPERHALGPLQVQISLNAPFGAFGALELRRLDATAYVNLNLPGRLIHIVTPDADIQAAGGEADLFGRMTIRPDGTRSAMISGTFEQIDLDQLVHFYDPGSEPMPGRLTGQIVIAGDPFIPRDLFGNVSAALTDADLMNSDPFGFLYFLLNVGSARQTLQGRGSIQARLENTDVDVTRFYLANRGVEVRGAGKIRDVFKMPDSELHAFLVGTSRPLRSIRLPLFADVEEVLSSLQASATAVEVTGTAREPVVRMTTFDSIGRSLQLTVAGDVQAQKRGE